MLRLIFLNKNRLGSQSLADIYLWFCLDRSQSDFYFVPQEIQTDTATPLSMEIFGRIDFSLGRLITRVTKTPKPTKQHVTWAVELVRIFFHSLLWPWEPLS